MKSDVAMAKLIFISEHFAGKVYELALEKTTVGRGGGNTLAIHDPSVSLAHCEILVHGPEVIVRDLGSANGTFVNRVSLNHQQAQLKSGQVVRFGSVEARLELDPSDDEHGSSDITAVHEHARLVREQSREENRPKVADPSMTLDDDAEPSGSDVTMVLPLSSQPKAPPPSSSQERAGRPRQKVPGKVGVLIVGALILGLAVLLWLIRSNHAG